MSAPAKRPSGSARRKRRGRRLPVLKPHEGPYGGGAFLAVRRGWLRPKGRS